MKLYETMRGVNPDFFIHSGDQIYADGPLQAEVKLDDGTIWKNVVDAGQVEGGRDAGRVPRQLRLQPARRQHARASAAEVPILVQWDDHEARNNWYPGPDSSATSATP